MISLYDCFFKTSNWSQTEWQFLAIITDFFITFFFSARIFRCACRHRFFRLLLSMWAEAIENGTLHYLHIPRLIVNESLFPSGEQYNKTTRLGLGNYLKLEWSALNEFTRELPVCHETNFLEKSLTLSTRETFLPLYGINQCIFELFSLYIE